MNTKILNSCLRLLLAAIVFALAVPLAAQDVADSDDAIEVVRQGIPHDALFALEMSGKWGLATGAFGLMLETQDGGGTWNLLQPQTHLGLFGIAHAAGKTVVVGQQGFVMTRDGDSDWQVVDSGFDQRLLNVGMNDAGLAVSIGEFGFIARSRDAGATWEQITLNWGDFNDEGYEPHLYDAVVAADGSIMIAGEFGLILRSTDGGDTFAAVHTGDQSVFDMHMARDGSNTGYAVGQEGLVTKTTDGGATWQDVDANTGANLLGVWSGNGEVVIAGIRELLRSSDDGASFTNTADIRIARTWFQGVGAGVSETQAGERGFLRQQSVYIVGHQATIGRVIK